MKFNNRDNKVYQTEDGPIWHSRSTALVIVLFFLYEYEFYTLIEKRGPKMDEPGKWCIPCGYLDWDEDAGEAMTREIYEETTLHIPSFKNVLYEDPKTKPFFVNTDPKENRQNISLSYVKAFNIKTKEEKNRLWALEDFSNDEVDKIELVGINELKKYSFAFNHDERIRMGWKHYIKNKW